MSETSTNPGATRGAILEGYLTESELAMQLGRGVRTLARWRALDEGPPVTRIGREILYRKSSVKAWLEGREQDA
jgi:Helix-turn-helix domain